MLLSLQSNCFNQMLIINPPACGFKRERFPTGGVQQVVDSHSSLTSDKIMNQSAIKHASEHEQTNDWYMQGQPKKIFSA